MRLRNNPNAASFLQKSNIVVKAYPFLIANKAIIELGMGKGKMITTLASNNPNKTYIGVEKNATIALKALKKSEKLKLKNFYIINDDISEISSMFQGQFETIWLTFSDPWPKARHEKRRLTSNYFLSLYEKILKPKGLIRLKTDNDAFFAYSLATFKKAGWTINNISRDLSNFTAIIDNVKTEYEEKWSFLGKKINYLEARK